VYELAYVLITLKKSSNNWLKPGKPATQHLSEKAISVFRYFAR